MAGNQGRIRSFLAGYQVSGKKLLRTRFTLPVSPEVQPKIERTTSANPNTLAIVYLSGQGAEVRGREYLAARDSQVASEDDLVRLIDVTEFISKLQERSAAQIIIFDYCRDNPFEKSNPR